MCSHLNTQICVKYLRQVLLVKYQMSGYRTLHRYRGPVDQSINNIPIWSLCFSPCSQSRAKPVPPITTTNPPHRLLACYADGVIRAYSLLDKNILSSSSDEVIDATALTMHQKGGLQASAAHSNQETSCAPQLGSCKMSIVRNYTGELNASGEEIIASISLDGWVRIWKRGEQPVFLPLEEKEKNCSREGIEIVNPVFQFYVEKATGTNIALSPASWGGKSLIVAVGCRDGSVVLYHTDIAVNSHGEMDDKTKKLSPGAGQIFAQLSERKSTVTSLAFSPNGMSLAIGRKDGSIDIFAIDSNFRRSHHVVAHWGMVRALEFTVDGAILLTGGDDGKINAYDIIERQKMALVSQFVGHTRWVLDISSCPDGRRFASSSSDKTIRVWDLGMRDSVHTFDGHDDQVWGISFNEDGSRLASCGDDGMIQIYSCDI